MKFGERVRELRQKRSLTQRDLGAQVGVEFSYISKIENGKLDFGPWEQIFYGEFDGRRPKRVLIKIIGE